MDSSEVKTGSMQPSSRSESFGTPEFRSASIPGPSRPGHPAHQPAPIPMPTPDQWLAVQALLRHLKPTDCELPFLLTNKQGSVCELQGMPGYRIDIETGEVTPPEEEEVEEEKEEDEEEEEEEEEKMDLSLE